MKLNFDGLKHTLGYLAVVVSPVAGSYALGLGWHPHLCAAGAVIGCGLVAFLCGAQSQAVFLKQVEAEVKKAES